MSYQAKRLLDIHEVTLSLMTSYRKKEVLLSGHCSKGLYSLAVCRVCNELWLFGDHSKLKFFTVAPRKCVLKLFVDCLDRAQDSMDPLSILFYFPILNRDPQKAIRWKDNFGWLALNYIYIKFLFKAAHHISWFICGPFIPPLESVPKVILLNHLCPIVLGWAWLCDIMYALCP